MKIIQANAEIINPVPSKEEAAKIIKVLNIAGRTCYKSEANGEESERKFVRDLIERGHEAMLEHAWMTVKFTVDRGVSHELVRHRIASFAQESTRYCNYSKDKFGNEITFIFPCFFGKDSNKYSLWLEECQNAEFTYFEMLKLGATPEKARSILPNSLKTEVIMTANMREWRHFFRLRAAGETGKPHPQMLEVAVPLLEQCREWIPDLFGDIHPMEAKEEN